MECGRVVACQMTAVTALLAEMYLVGLVTDLPARHLREVRASESEPKWARVTSEWVSGVPIVSLEVWRSSSRPWMYESSSGG